MPLSKTIRNTTLSMTMLSITTQNAKRLIVARIFTMNVVGLSVVAPHLELELISLELFQSKNFAILLIEPFIYEDSDKYLIFKAFFDQEGELITVDTKVNLKGSD
jgi:hypothetical protein